jgi:hypothetical protein
MPKRSRKPEPDTNEIAASIVARVSDQAPPGPPERQTAKERASAIAAELGRRGGLKGGKARAVKLSAKKRKAIAKKAAAARWSKR